VLVLLLVLDFEDSINELELKEARAGSPSRPFLRDEPMSREKKAA